MNETEPDSIPKPNSTQHENKNENKNQSLEVIYLHGFASGPKSAKAVFFAQKLAELEIKVHIPDLNQPSFEFMTLSSQLQVVRETLEQIPHDRSLVLIGSSMGGLIATMTAKHTNNLKALVLLAPGFGLAKRWPALFGEQSLNDWKEKGWLDVFNYAAGKPQPLSYKFFEDIANHQTDELLVNIPTIIFHGKGDETVPISASERFADRNHQYARLYTLDDDHQLLASTEYMWRQCNELLGSL